MAEDEVLRLQGEEKQYLVLTDASTEAITSSGSELASLNGRMESDRQRKQGLEAQINALEREIAETEQELAVLSDGQSVAAEQSNRLSEKMTAIRMEAASLEAEKVTAQDSIHRLQGLELAMRGDREQKLHLIDSYQQENEGILSQIDAQKAAFAAQTALADQQKQTLKVALEERMQIEARKTATEKEAQNKNRDILNMERESARLEAKKVSAETEEKQIIDKLWETYELTRSTAAGAASEIESVASASKKVAE